jgi:acetylornithine deacetylase/succinyl-diaminopimelate desuccinylase-like protein
MLLNNTGMNPSTQYFSKHHERFISEWREFLSFPSVSTDPAYGPHCVACADWLATHLTKLGFRAELWTTATKPLVYGVLPGNPAKPTVLFYGHYDVQPPEPLELWSSPPFEPTLRDGRMYARGAQDNKGQVFYFVKAIEALRAQGADLPTIKVLIEGEEESGSLAMHAGLPQWREPLSADILMVCDTGMVAPGQPTITMGLRGIVGCEVKVHGPAVDIHSGVYGGIVLNPIHALTKIVSGMFHEDGSIAIPGFYDGVVDPSPQDRALANSAPLDLEAIAQKLGVPLAGGERALPPMERRGFRPTIEVNGIGGGYQGVGGKTVIPSFAMAKISSRLVAGQEPEATLAKIKKYVRDAAPVGCRVEFTAEKLGGQAFRLSTSSAVIKTATEAIRRSFGCDPVFLWEGASVPIIPDLAATAGAEPLLVGFGLEEDSIHSPNESFSLRQLEEGYRYTVAFLQSV